MDCAAEKTESVKMMNRDCGMSLRMGLQRAAEKSCHMRTETARMFAGLSAHPDFQEENLSKLIADEPSKISSLLCAHVGDKHLIQQKRARD